MGFDAVQKLFIWMQIGGGIRLWKEIANGHLEVPKGNPLSLGPHLMPCFKEVCKGVHSYIAL